MKSIRIIICIFIIIATGGCFHVDPPLKGYFYQGVLPPDAKADIFSISQFASDLSLETGLTITHKSNSNVFLASNGNGKKQFTVNISFYAPKNTVYIAVRGDIESPEALAATQKASELFQKKYPASKLQSMTVYPGALGP